MPLLKTENEAKIFHKGRKFFAGDASRDSDGTSPHGNDPGGEVTQGVWTMSIRLTQREDRVPRRAAQTAHRAVVENRMTIMTYRVSPVEVAILTDAELLRLYLSLPPASRETAFIRDRKSVV